MQKFALAAALLVAAPVLSHAQSEVEWAQTVSIPKGAHVPREQADLIGIEIGDTYAEAKAKLAKLFEEGVQPRQVKLPVPPFTASPAIPVKEEVSRFNLQMPGTSQILTARYVAELKMERQTKGSGARPVDEAIKVYLSSPASGHQVLGVERNIRYNNENDQPRIPDVIALVNAKLQGTPFVEMHSESVEYKYQFDNGKLISPPKAPHVLCTPKHTVSDTRSLPLVNKSGDCDALLWVKIGFGLSRDHAKYIDFVLSDNDRVKANLTADFTFVENYVRGKQERTRGAPPKL